LLPSVMAAWSGSTRVRAMRCGTGSGTGLLDELAGGQAPDGPGLDAVVQQLLVGPLQRQAPALGDEVHHRRQDEQRDAEDPAHQVDVDPEDRGDDVVAAGDHEHQVEGDRHGADGGADRDVAGRSSRLWYAWSPLKRASIQGYSAMTVKMSPGMTTVGTSTLIGTV
jgi:hypothetical protein